MREYEKQLKMIFKYQGLRIGPINNKYCYERIETY